MSQLLNNLERRRVIFSILSTLFISLIVGSITSFFVGYMVFMATLPPMALTILTWSSHNKNIVIIIALLATMANLLFLIYAIENMRDTMKFLFTVIFTLEFALMAFLADRYALENSDNK